MVRVLLIGVAAIAGVLQCARLEVPNGDFSKPDNQRHLAPWQADGFERVEGGEMSSMRWIAPAPWNEAVALMPGAKQRVNLAMPAIPESELPATGWYGVLSVDVLGLESAGKGKLTLRLLSADGESILAEEALRIEFKAPSGGETETSYGSYQRLWVRIDPAVSGTTAGKSALAEIEIEGKRAVVCDNLRLERFHANPTRKLLCKANGVLGPDLLARFLRAGSAHRRPSGAGRFETGRSGGRRKLVAAVGLFP